MVVEQGELRLVALKQLQVVFDKLLESLPHTASIESVVRQLTETFEREQAAVGQLCDDIEARARAYYEQDLADFKETVNELFGAASTFASSAQDPQGRNPKAVVEDFKRQIEKLEIELAQRIAEARERSQYFNDSLQYEFNRRVGVIAERFHKEALSIMAAGVMADYNAEILNSDSEGTIKH